jgi:hypothetical protein
MTEQTSSPLADGFFFERPKDGAPSFVKGKLSIQVDKAIAFLNQHKNEKNYVNLDLKEAKESKKLYLSLNSWKPEQKQEEDLNSSPF